MLMVYNVLYDCDNEVDFYDIVNKFVLKTIQEIKQKFEDPRWGIQAHIYSPF